MKYEYLTDESGLRQFCDAMDNASCIAFDTEFISEDRYRPELCLLQVAVDDQLAIVDPLEIGDISVFWQRLMVDDHVTVVHAGREEYLFCLAAVGAAPANWFDTQLAAGFVSSDYPASYASLVQRWLSKSVRKGETRTNWRRRPLNSRQLNYALTDVVHLKPLYQKLRQRLENLNRAQWLREELAVWQSQLQNEQTTKRWRRVSGHGNMNRRQLAILRELWKWRDAESRRRDVPSRRLLRDDLMVELARRETADQEQIRTVRGMDWRRLRKYLPDIAECIGGALDLPEEQWPGRPRRSERPAFNVLAQFLATALNGVARGADLAPTLVGTVQDIRDLIAHHLGLEVADTPRLAVGWRHEIAGQIVTQLLDGQLSIRVADPKSDQPMVFDPVERR